MLMSIRMQRFVLMRFVIHSLATKVCIAPVAVGWGLVFAKLSLTPQIPSGIDFADRMFRIRAQ